MAISLRRIEERPLGRWEDRPWGLWNEGGSFSDLERRMSRMFDDFLRGSLVGYVSPDTRGVFSPRTDITETDKNIIVAAELPGIDQKDVDVSVHNGILTISGEKKLEKEDKDIDYFSVERVYGCFSRDITLPDYVDTEKLEAAYKNGVLTVTLPKTEKARQHMRKIPVKFS